MRNPFEGRIAEEWQTINRAIGNDELTISEVVIGPMTEPYGWQLWANVVGYRTWPPRRVRWWRALTRRRPAPRDPLVIFAVSCNGVLVAQQHAWPGLTRLGRREYPHTVERRYVLTARVLEKWATATLLGTPADPLMWRFADDEPTNGSAW